MKKFRITLLLLFTAIITIATGCGNKKNEDLEKVEEKVEEQPKEEEKEIEEENKKVIKVAASATPHAEILEEAKKLLKEQGVELEIVVFNDYVQPNKVVDAGDFDANFFQHGPYLNSFNEEQKTKLVSAGTVHYEPLGIYPKTAEDINKIPHQGIIAVPNDTTNEARALLLLQANGFITLKEDAGINATINDIEENPFELEIKELEAAQIPRVRNEMDFVVLNGNYALEAGLTVKKDALAYEQSDSEAAVEYANVIAVKEGNESNENIKALMEVLHSEEIKNFINEKYEGAVVPTE